MFLPCYETTPFNFVEYGWLAVNPFRGYGNPKLVSVLGKLYSKLYGLPIDANNQVR